MMPWSAKNLASVLDLNDSNFPPSRKEKGTAGCNFNVQS